MAVVLDFFEYKFFKRVVPVEKVTLQARQDNFMRYLVGDLSEIMDMKNKEDINTDISVI